jgi:hypothetical protein
VADTSNAMEGLKLIADWAKWLITIETAAIGVIGAYLKGNSVVLPRVVKILSTVAIGSFVISIATSRILALPKILSFQVPLRAPIFSEFQLGTRLHFHNRCSS